MPKILADNTGHNVHTFFAAETESLNMYTPIVGSYKPIGEICACNIKIPSSSADAIYEDKKTCVFNSNTSIKALSTCDIVAYNLDAGIDRLLELASVFMGKVIIAYYIANINNSKNKGKEDEIDNIVHVINSLNNEHVLNTEVVRLDLPNGHELQDICIKITFKEQENTNENLRNAVKLISQKHIMSKKLALRFNRIVKSLVLIRDAHTKYGKWSINNINTGSPIDSDSTYDLGGSIIMDSINRYTNVFLSVRCLSNNNYIIYKALKCAAIGELNDTILGKSSSKVKYDNLSKTGIGEFIGSMFSSTPIDPCEDMVAARVLMNSPILVDLFKSIIILFEDSVYSLESLKHPTIVDESNDNNFRIDKPLLNGTCYDYVNRYSGGAVLKFLQLMRYTHVKKGPMDRSISYDVSSRLCVTKTYAIAGLAYHIPMILHVFGGEKHAVNLIGTLERAIEAQLSSKKTKKEHCVIGNTSVSVYVDASNRLIIDLDPSLIHKMFGYLTLSLARIFKTRRTNGQIDVILRRESMTSIVGSESEFEKGPKKLRTSGVLDLNTLNTAQAMIYTMSYRCLDFMRRFAEYANSEA